MSTEIKTEEQIPLTTPAVTETETTTETPAVVAPEEPKPKRNWFRFNQKKPAAAVVDETNVEEGAGGEEKPLKEKSCWWSKCKKQKGEDEQKQDNIAIGMDFVNRDANGLNNHVQFNFDDVFGEADSTHSWEWVWTANATVFNFVRLFVYRIFALLAFPFTLLFAIFFGLFAAVNVFVIVPLGKLLSVPGNLLAKLWNWLVHAIFDPLASAVGLIFSNFNIRKYGINQETTAPCV